MLPLIGQLLETALLQTTEPVFLARELSVDHAGTSLAPFRCLPDRNRFPSVVDDHFIRHVRDTLLLVFFSRDLLLTMPRAVN